MQEILTKHLLSFVIFAPLAGAFLLLFFKRPPDEEEAHGHEHGEDETRAKTSSAAAAVRWFALLISLLTFGLSIGLVCLFHPSASGFQLVEGPYFFPELAETSEEDELEAIRAGQIRATRVDYAGKLR